MKILIVDDDSEITTFFKTLAEEWGHSIKIAENGDEALNVFDSTKFDLVFLDIFLPDAMGYDLIPKFRKIFPEIPVVAMTGKNSRELEVKVRAQGVIYYMVKPSEPKTIKGILDHVSQKTKRLNPELTRRKETGDQFPEQGNCWI